MQGAVQQGAIHPDQSLLPPSPFVLRDLNTVLLSQAKSNSERKSAAKVN